jgi:hypothetical protein
MYVPPFEECENVHVLLFSALLTHMKLAIGEQISTLELSYLSYHIFVVNQILSCD